MRAVRYHETGNPEVLAVEEIDRPSPGEGEILIDIRAASVNPIDIRYRSGRYEPPAFPMTPGTDFAGIVAEVGPGVDTFREGDRVFGAGLHRAGPDRGTYAEYAVAPANLAAKLPSAVSFQAGAAVAHVGQTAWHTVIEIGGLALQDTCLVHGGSGGVGHIAVQLASLAGARVISTAGTERKRSRVRELGATAVFDYAREDLEAAILDVCEGLGRPNVILDHRLHDHLALDIAVAPVGGTIVVIAGDEVTFDNTSTAVSKGLAIRFTGTSKIADPRDVLDRLGRVLTDGLLTVDIAESFDLAEAASAQLMVAEESYLGKVVVTMD